MTSLFKKLNLKPATTSIVVLNAPDSFRSEMTALDNIQINENFSANAAADFIMAFVTQQQQVDELAAIVANQLANDGVLWFCYPKGSSKKYKCNFNRDTGWSILGSNGFEPVRMIAIDADWSALRFRQVQHIKKMTRRSALSDAGKEKAGLK